MPDETRTTSFQCPSWCLADHATQVHPEDALHWGDIGHLTAIEVVAGDDGSHLNERGLQVDVGVERGFAADTAYVSLVVDELRARSLLITPDSARRLSQVLGRAASAARE